MSRLFQQTILARMLWAGLITGFISTAQADVVTDWNESLLEAVRADRTPPPRASRAGAIIHAAIYDAVNGIHRTHRPYLVTTVAPDGASVEAAVAAAGYTASISLFSNASIQSTNLLVRYQAQINTIPEGRAKGDGLAWGRSVAEAYLAWRANDGSTAPSNYTPSNQPGRWKPIPPAQAGALLPGWGKVTPFCVTDVPSLRPQAPPPLDTAAYAFELNTVKAYGAAKSTVRTANQTEVAQFWSDGAGTVTPPGHWNRIARTVAATKGLSVAENARLFALLNLALADAAICCWDAKYAFDYWRPITAIREADTDGNPETEADATWEPLIATPPFPEYTSGHSTFSRSAATVLAQFFGSDQIAFTTTSDGLPGVTRSYAGFSAAADDAGISRLYGGIHWPSANLHGQSAGARIGEQVVNLFLQPLHALSFSLIAHASGETRLELRAEPNRNYLIRASSDLNTWEELAVLSSADGWLRWTDPHALQSRLRFYQAMIKP